VSLVVGGILLVSWVGAISIFIPGHRRSFPRVGVRHVLCYGRTEDRNARFQKYIFKILDSFKSRFRGWKFLEKAIQNVNVVAQQRELD
jgi:hypothetical protein